MPSPEQTPDDAPQPATSASRIVITKVFVRGLEVQAQIGVYKHEKGRSQRLVIDVELDVAVTDWSQLTETVNYEVIAAKARKVAEGHRGLVETFAHHLAEACFEEPKVTRARIRVEKPSALAPDAAAAGVEITAVRG